MQSDSPIEFADNIPTVVRKRRTVWKEGGGKELFLLYLERFLKNYKPGVLEIIRVPKLRKVLWREFNPVFPSELDAI